MAVRPVFYVSNGKVRRRDVEFEWFPGFSVSQKQKSIESFHFSIKRTFPGAAVLEVSTKSREELGRKMSAFSLRLGGVLVENIYQSSKVFEKGGPYTDLLEVDPKDAKRDPRLKESGAVTGFFYDGRGWPTQPGSVFYDFIYLQALRECLTEAEWEELKKYSHFTDIEFNPSRGRNTQARSAAIACLLAGQDDSALGEWNAGDFVRMHESLVMG